MNNLQLKAIRKALGLEVADLAVLLNKESEKENPNSVKNRKRNIQRYEKGTRVPPKSYIQDLHSLVFDYQNMMSFLSQDIKRWHEENPKLETEDEVEYSKWVKNRPRLVFPFYQDYELFKQSHAKNSEVDWRMYQICVARLFVENKIDDFDDGCVLSENSKLRWYLNELPLLDNITNDFAQSIIEAKALE